jgi:hypothetical protein
MLPGIVTLLTLAALSILPAAAEAPRAQLPLSQLAACERTPPPRLPEKWRGIYLMAPFTDGQLVLAEIVSDAALSAMRVKLHGVKHGSVDLLVVGKTTYVLKSEGSAIRECRALGDTGWRALTKDWLAPRSQCTGVAPISETSVEWWKTAIPPEPASYWIWYKTSDRSPFRLVFPFASDRLPPLSRYALSYQARFETLEENGLGDIAATCAGASRKTAANPTRRLRALIDAMAQSGNRAESEIGRLMPELDANCSANPLPTWPDKLAITGVMTPFDSDESPYPTEVLYDWTVQGHRARTFGGPEPGIIAQDALLLGPQGYTVTHHGNDRLTCKPVLPGTIRPDWAKHAPCACAATINGTTSLSPYGTTHILRCPLASPRVAWAWYALSGRPTAFMVTSLPGDQGKRLFALLDYHSWVPDHSFSHDVFRKPRQCASAAGSRTDSSPSHCATCHLGRTSSR